MVESTSGSAIRGGGPPSGKGFCLADNGLLGLAGHHCDEAKLLRDEARKQGYEFITLGPVKVSDAVLSGIKVEKVFRRSYYDPGVSIRAIGPLLNFVALNFAFYRDLTAALKGRLDPNWVLYFPCVDHKQLAGLGWWLRRRPRAERSRVKIFLRGHQYFDSTGRMVGRRAIWARLAFKALEYLGRDAGIEVVTDSELLTERYARLTTLPIRIVPIPISDFTSLSVPAEASGRRLELVSLGEARGEKGFCEVLEALKLLRPELAAGVLSARLQANERGDARLRAAISDFEAAGLPNVRLIKRELSTAEYNDLLLGGDVVLLPYRKRGYGERSSGVLVEAFATGKPVVTTSGTWMALQVEKHGGGVLCADGDPADLARAIRACVGRYPELRDQVLKGRERWVAFHNAASFFRALTQ